MTDLNTGSLIVRALNEDIAEMDIRFDSTDKIRNELIEKTLVVVDTISGYQNPDTKTINTFLGAVKTANDLLNSRESAIATKVSVKSKVKSEQSSSDIKDEIRQMVATLGNATHGHTLDFEQIKSEISSVVNNRGDVVRESELLVDPTITTI